MSSKDIFESINTNLQYIKGDNHIFGDTTVLLAGDFRQTLPVIQRGIVLQFSI